MNNFRNLLVPTDFGPAAWNALNIAIEMCSDKKSKVTLLHIYPSSAKFSSRSNNNNHNDSPEMDRIRNKMMSISTELVNGRDIQIESVILRGWVEKEIIDFLEENSFDLIVMGVNSNGLNNRPGSHITKMIETTGTPLMVIPNTPVKEVVYS